MFKYLFSFSHTKRLFPALFFGSYLTSRTLFNCHISTDKKENTKPNPTLFFETKLNLIKNPDKLSFFEKIKTNYLYSDIEEYINDLIYLNSSNCKLEKIDLLDFYKITDFMGDTNNFSNEFKKYILENYLYKFNLQSNYRQLIGTSKLAYYLSLSINSKSVIYPSTRWNIDENKFILTMNRKKRLYYNIYILDDHANDFYSLVNMLDKNIYISPDQFIKFKYECYNYIEGQGLTKIK